MTFDPNTKFGKAPVSVAPSPATSGTSLTADVGAADAFALVTPPYYALLRPGGTDPNQGNAETVLVTAAASGTRQGIVDITVLQDGSAGQGSVDVTVVDPGGTANAQQRLTVTGDGGTFILTFLGVSTAALAYNASDGTIQTALNGLSSISGYASVTVANTRDGGPDANARQTLTVNASGGTYTLTFAGETTAAIAWNANDAAIQAALEALASIEVADITVTAGVIEFVGGLALTPVPLITANRASLTGTGSVTVSGGIVTFGGGLLAGKEVAVLEANVAALTYSTAGRNEQVLVAVRADGGTFTLTLGANTTGALAEAASAATVQTALRGLASIGAGNVNVTGDNGGPYTLEFVSGKANTNMGAVTGSAASLTLNTRVFTIARAQKGSTARSVVVGDTIEVTTVPDRTLIHSTITADQNDYAPVGMAPDTVVVVSNLGVAQRKITGFAGGADGRRLSVILGPSAYPVELTNEDAASAAGNRMTWDANLGSVLLRWVGDSVTLQFDAVLNRWSALDGTDLRAFHTYAAGGAGPAPVLDVSAYLTQPGLIARNYWVGGTTDLAGMEWRDSNDDVILAGRMGAVYTPTQPPGDNTTNVATTEYVDQAIAVGGSGTAEAFAYLMGD